MGNMCGGSSNSSATAAGKSPGGKNAGAKPAVEYKVLVIGDKGVGKTSFVYRAVHDRFVAQSSSAEPGVDHFTKERETKDFVMDGGTVRVTLIDAGSVDQFRAVSSSIYAEANGVLMMCSFDSSQSLQNCSSSWYKQVERYCPKNTPIILIANKSDLAEKAVDENRLEHLAQQLEIPHRAVSAKDNVNVQEAVQLICQTISKAGPHF